MRRLNSGMHDEPKARVGKIAEQVPESKRTVGALDRTGRARKTRRLKAAAVAAGLAGTTFFTGLVVETGQAAAPHNVVTPDQQLARLEHANNGAFFSVDGANVPAPGAGSAQTSSGGS